MTGMANPTTPRVSGAALIDQLRVCRELVGDVAMDRALARLSPDERAEFDRARAVSWVDTDLAERAYRLIAEEAGRNLTELHSEVVRKGLQQTFRTLWRAILRFTTDSALIARTPLIYSRAFDRGQMTSKIDSNGGRADVELTGWPGMPVFQMNALAVAISTVLDLAGRKEAKVAFERRPDGAFFLATWRP